MLEVHCAHGYHARMAAWDVDPELLRTYLVVRRHRNLTRAAEELYVSQSAVSRRMGRLERSLGLPLVERLGKSFHLTEAGEVLAREAEALIGSVDRLAESVRSRRSGERGRIRVGASTTPGLYFLPAVLLRFQALRPDVEVRYCVENSLRVEEKIVSNELDLAVVGAHLSHGALRQRPLFEDDVVFYAAEGHPLAKRRSVAPRELERETAIVREPGSATRRDVDAWLRRARVRFGREIEIGCPESAKALVRSGLGFGYLSSMGLRGSGGAGLVRLPVVGMKVWRPLRLVLHAEKRITPAMQTMLSTIAEMATASR